TAMARRLEDPATLAAVLTHRHWALYGPDDIEGLVATADEIVALGEQLDEGELVLLGTQCRLHAYLEIGDAEQVKRAAAVRTALAEELRQPQYLWSAKVYAAYRAAVQGRFADAFAFADDALAAREPLDPAQ